jgi:hypothetical protein
MNAERPSGSPAPDAGADLPRREKWIAGILLVLALALRCFYIFHYRYDSDEPQHLHTTWGWTQGLLQYRDFFDNHTPLFHILFSPLVAALGERTNILDFMRFAMVPLWFVCWWCVWKIGAALFSRRVGMWATVLISLLPWWFFPALEYRTDNLWTPLWLGAVATFVCGTYSRRRAFAGGMLLGLCFAVSLKTSLLCAVLALVTVVTPLIVARRLDFTLPGRVLAAVWPVLAGMVIAPALVAGYFAMRGAWAPFLYGTIQHNILPDVDSRNHPLYLRFVFPVALPFLLAAAVWIARRAPDDARALRRAGLFLLAGFYFTGLYTFWTLLTRQDFLPFYPLLAVLAAAGLLCLSARFLPRHQACVLVALGLLEIGLVLGGRPPFKMYTVKSEGDLSKATGTAMLVVTGKIAWVDETQREREILDEVLQLTKPGEYVMDFKGESVFRRRAFYYVMEPLTYYRMRHEMIPDTVAEDLVRTHTYVVLNQDRWYPKKGAEFIGQNYLAVGKLPKDLRGFPFLDFGSIVVAGRMRVAGKVIANRPTAEKETIRFEVAVPASYVLRGDNGHVLSGTLDGTPLTGPRDLAAGPHEFKPDAPDTQVAIFWSRAAELGFLPVLDQPGWQYYR